MNNTPICPICGGDGEYMGALGDMEWFRCIQCGAEFERQTDMTDEGDEDE